MVAKGRALLCRDPDCAVEVEVSEVLEGEEGRHEARVLLLDEWLEEKDPVPPAVADDAEFFVKPLNDVMRLDGHGLPVHRGAVSRLCVHYDLRLGTLEA